MKKIWQVVGAALVLGIAGAAWADEPAAAVDAPAKLGADYDVIEGTALASPALPVKVEEFFWYGCPHCYAMETPLEAWVAQLPADVQFTRVPNSLGRDVGVLHSKAFYAAQMLGITDQVHRALFDGLHRDHLPLLSKQAIAEFFAAHAHVQASAVEAAFDSFVVEGNVSQAEEEAQRYRISGTPSLVIDGHYSVKIAEPARMLNVADQLIALIRSGQAPAPGMAAAPAASSEPQAAPRPPAAAESPAKNRLPLGWIAAGIALLLVVSAVILRKR